MSGTHPPPPTNKPTTRSLLQLWNQQTLSLCHIIYPLPTPFFTSQFNILQTLFLVEQNIIFRQWSSLQLTFCIILTCPCWLVCVIFFLREMSYQGHSDMRPKMCKKKNMSRIVCKTKTRFFKVHSFIDQKKNTLKNYLCINRDWKVLQWFK